MTIPSGEWRADYQEFLERKRVVPLQSGFSVSDADINPMLFDFQKEIVRWALRLGKAAIFSECGTGKTPMQLEWAAHVSRKTGRPVLILAPLAVAAQTVEEGEKFHIAVTLCRKQSDIRPGVNVTNYDKLQHFDASAFGGVVLDESSILKNFTGKIKQLLISTFAITPYKLACTATPAPNDHLELGNHSQFLDVMDSNEMISRWFINDTMAAGNYRLKNHAVKEYWRWVCSWAVCLEKPSDLGYFDEGFDIPELEITQHVVSVDHSNDDGTLFRMATMSATGMHSEMRRTARDRAREVRRIVGDSDEAWTIWCNTDYEEKELTALFPDAGVVRGPQKETVKERHLADFSQGRKKVLISKPSICGFGMNWQHCRNIAFVGLSYSYEQLYQALRRSWRYGQTKKVTAHIVIAESEGSVLKSIQTKQAEHEKMKREMVEAMREVQLEGGTRRELTMHAPSGVEIGDTFTAYHGDCVEAIGRVEDASVGFSIFSPPFSNLYIYSDSLRDMGNTSDDREFFEHFSHLIPELYRITKPGRLCAVHCKDLPLYKGRDGAAGLRDFPGAIIDAFEAHGWTFHSRCTIWKDPVIEMQRTKNHGLLYKELCKDSSCSRQGMADYLICFRRFPQEGDILNPVTVSGERFHAYSGLEPPDAGYIAMDNNMEIPAQENGKWPRVNPFPCGSRAYREWSITVWQKYASDVWMDIDQTDVLNYDLARAANDEKHICPLQLGVIERALHLWTNPGDMVFSPFMGIGSEGHVALRMGRKFTGIELKESYFRHAVDNLNSAISLQSPLFNPVEVRA